MDYKIPGVNIEEVHRLPSSIAQVETAIPAFIGYTEKAEKQSGEPFTDIEPVWISSLLAYERLFGNPDIESGLTVDIQGALENPSDIKVFLDAPSKYRMQYALKLYFANGGGPCYVVSVGDYSTKEVKVDALKAGLAVTERIDEITLYVYPDAQNIQDAANYYDLFKETLDICAKLKDRFSVMDIWQNERVTSSNYSDVIDRMRSADLGAGEEISRYGASYFPNLKTSFAHYYGREGEGDSNVTVIGAFSGTLADLKIENNTIYLRAQSKLRTFGVEMSPSPAIVGVYARVDAHRGVWKAPANLSLNLVQKPMVEITDQQQNDLNIDPVSGRSVNAIRSFPDKGILVWGARTLAGNSNEWRYVSVRRFFNMVEESVKKATVQFTFEPNDSNTWSWVKILIDNFLVQQWRAGALAGSKPEAAFFVKVGLNETMSQADIQQGRMIIEIGMAVVRPAEFIILRIRHNMLTP